MPGLSSGKISNVELRSPDLHCSLHLALAALMQAGTLGLAAKQALPAPVPRVEKEKVRHIGHALEAAGRICAAPKPAPCTGSPHAGWHTGAGGLHLCPVEKDKVSPRY